MARFARSRRAKRLDKAQLRIKRCRTRQIARVEIYHRGSVGGHAVPRCRPRNSSELLPARLSQRQLAISVGRHAIAPLAELGVAAAITHDPADLLALDIAVDARHPRVDLGEQQALA